MLHDEKRQEIIDAAIDLFAKYGISKVSVDKIAREIGATRGRIYHYLKRGKPEIVDAILEMYEDCVNSCLPSPREWEAQDADAEQILYKLLFQFPAGNMRKLRKITRIIMSEMYYDEQIKRHFVNYFIIARENRLTACFTALMRNGKIVPINAESMARYFNRHMLVCAIEVALRYPYVKDEEKADELQRRVVKDYTNFVHKILSKTNC